MIIRDEGDQDLASAMKELRAPSGLANQTHVSPRERRERLGQTGVTLWLTGRAGSGKVTLAYVLERKLFDLGHAAHVLSADGEALPAIGVAAKACTDASLITICALTANTRAQRSLLREKVGAERFVEVFVDVDAALCRERRPDGDHAGFEEPDAPALVLKLDETSIEAAVDSIIALLAGRGQVDVG